MNQNDDQSVIVVQQKTALPSVFALSKEAFSFYRANWKQFALIALAPCILSVLAALSTGTGFNGLVSIISTVVSLIANIVMIELVIKNGVLGEGVQKAYSSALRKLLPFLWVSSLVFAVIFGGFALLIIPGIYLTILLSFSVFVYLTEERRGMSALVQSWHYVRGYWWPVFGRFVFFWLIVIVAFAVIGILSSVLGINPQNISDRHLHPAYIILNDLVNIFFIVPFSIAYMYLVFQSLKSIKTVALTDEEEKKIKRKARTFMIIGFAAVIIMAATAVYLTTITGIDFEDPQSVPTLMPNINS